MVGIEVKRVLCMNEGTDEISYAQTSYIQKQVLSLTKPMKETAIREVYTKKLPTTLYIADLGCSSAEQNTLNLIFELITAIENASHQVLATNKRSHEYQVYLNDLPGNDFNTIFRSLSSFEDKLKAKMGDDFGHCFVNGVPGSFYGRLFPSDHLHFVHSSYSLHWLSQVPEGIEANKGNIYIAKNSPPNVLKAYSDQFEKDFSMFLRCRSEELVAGGIMVLTVLGRKSNKLYSKEACYMWELLGMALNDMVAEGLIEEEKLNAFNIPQYPPSASEIGQLVEKEGSFAINKVHVSEVSWEANESNNNNKAFTHYEFFKCMRSVGEPLLKSHFEEAMVQEMLHRYKKYIQVSMDKEKNVFINVSVTLTRKDN